MSATAHDAGRGASVAVPLPTTTLLGRDAVLERVARLMGTQRLVTLTGAGGCGKTSLASHVAAAVAADGREVWWAELSPVDDPSRIATVLAEAVGLGDVSGRAAAHALTAELSKRSGVLVVANCEHLLEPLVEVLARLLQRCSELTVLATSREMLDLPGEHAVRIRPLVLPPDENVTWEQLATYAGTALFVERASAVTTLHPDDDLAPLVVRICRRLDGLPLAIELAASLHASSGWQPCRVRLLTSR